MAQEPLSHDEIEKKLSKLNVEWAEIDDSKLERVYNFEDYAQAKKHVDAIAEIAEEHDHHPEIWFTWGKVVVTLSTHSAHGLTVKDFQLASAIDAIS